jgi:hypothetical protein
MLVVLDYRDVMGPGWLRRVRMRLGGRYTSGVGFGMLVAASTFPITITMAASLTVFTMFAVSRRDVVP